LATENGRSAGDNSVLRPRIVGPGVRWERPRGMVIGEPCKEIVEEATDFCGHIQLIEPQPF